MAQETSLAAQGPHLQAPVGPCPAALACCLRLARARGPPQQAGRGQVTRHEVGARGRWKRPLALPILMLPSSRPQRLPQQRQLRSQLLTLRPYQLRPRHRLEERHLIAHRGPVSR